MDSSECFDVSHTNVGVSGVLPTTDVSVDEVGKSDSPSDERRPQANVVFKDLKLVFWDQDKMCTREGGMAYSDGTVVYKDGDKECLLEDGYIYDKGNLVFWSGGQWRILGESRIYKFEDLSDEWRWQGDSVAMFNGDVSGVAPTDKARISRFSKHPAARRAWMENGVRARPRAKRTGLRIVPYVCGPARHQRQRGCIDECGLHCARGDDEEFVEDDLYFDTPPMSDDEQPCEPLPGSDDEQACEPPAKKSRTAPDGWVPMWSFCPCHGCVESDTVSIAYETTDELDPDEDHNGNELEKPFGPDDPALPKVRGRKPKEGEDPSCPPKEPWAPYCNEDMVLNECQDSCQVCSKYLGIGFDESEATRVYISIRRLVRGYRDPSRANGWVQADPATIECFRVDPETKKHVKVAGAINSRQSPKKLLFVYHFIGGMPLPVCNQCLPNLMDAKDCPLCMRVGIPKNLIEGYPVKCLPKEINLDSY